MELGGNAPFIVAEDADLDAAVQGALGVEFSNGGQACTVASRFFVHEDVVDDFTLVRSLPPGSPGRGVDSPASTGGRPHRGVESVSCLPRQAARARS